tara:strand:- start:349 stop:606 length:258 start_codon:yes stop_codon:yes gene_type:complete
MVAMQEQSVIEGWRGVMVACGLRTPSQRAITAALITGAVSYAMKVPASSFRHDGSVRPSGGTADATHWHFLLTPSIVGATVFLFT